MMNITTKFWNRIAKTYEQQEARYPQMHAGNIANARKYLRASDLVLDFGCATGTKALELAGDVRKIQGIDISPEMVAAAKRNAAEQKVQNVHFTQATIFDQRFADGAFDVILAFGILHLLKNLPRALQRINILLKPGGWFVSSTACMGEDKTVPTVMNALLFIPSRIGIFPYLSFLKTPKLKRAVIRGGFQIAETEILPFDPNKSRSFVVGYFMAAKKV